jgi:ABC-type nitrate/sulfonate/bicarbonate transport system substrate-binding protein
MTSSCGTLGAVASLLLVAGGPAFAQSGGSGAPPGAPPAVLRIGLTSASLTYLPMHAAAEHTAAGEGIRLDLSTFDGPTGLVAALAAGSLDVGLMSLHTAVTMIGAGHPMRVFWVVSARGDFEWFARPAIRSWGDLRGRKVAIGGFGTLTDVMTRYVLQRHGLEPGRDVSLVQSGAAASRLTALRAERVDAALLLPPSSWEAEAAGLRRLGSQASEVAEQWPTLVFVARQPLLEGQPATIRALLRAHVRALRWIRLNREGTVELLMTRLKFERRHAERGQAEVAQMAEHGDLPSAVMPVFWEISMAAGEVTTPWPESRYFDRRFVDTFAQWEPAR